MARTSAAAAARMQARRLLEAVRRRVLLETGSRSASELVIEAHLRADGVLAGLNDPVGYVTRLRDCLEPARLSVAVVREEPGAPGADRFRRALEIVATALPPLPFGEAVRVARASDELVGNQTPIFHADVARHFLDSSSLGAKGRLLTAMVRYLRPAAVLELGTAYGMSALFLLSGLAATGGTLDTVEEGEVQYQLARARLAAEHGERARVHHGEVRAVVPRLVAARSFGLVFHDAAHGEEAYAGDFALIEPALAPGAVVLFDDIRWEAEPAGPPARTYAGWQRVARHPRVRVAAEIDRRAGIVLLG